jgi:hypothetical protein
MISDQAIFIHVPRNGGTSVETFFGNIDGHHQPASWYQQSCPAWWESRYKFAFIRNPWERMMSLYRYWTNVSNARWFQHMDEWVSIKERQEMTFKSWVKSFEDMVEKVPLLREAGWTDSHFQEQFWFLPDDDSVELFDLATVHQYWPEICEKCQVEFEELPHLNYATTEDKFNWTPELLDQVANLYPHDVTIWNSLRTQENL